MGNIGELNKTKTQLNFSTCRHTQNIWVKALLHCTKVDICDLATILNIPVDTLHKVHRGELVLLGGNANQLAQLFLVAFSD